MPLGASLGHQFETENTIFGQKHVFLEDVHTLNTLLAVFLRQSVVTVEVLFEWSSHDGAESVSGKGTGQHTDVSKSTFKRFVENVGDLVLKILDCHQRVDQILPTFAKLDVDFTTSASQILVIVEAFPEREEGFVTRLGAGINENADLRVEDTAKRSEKPSVRVDFLAVLLFETEQHLNRWESGAAAIIMRPAELLIGSD